MADQSPPPLGHRWAAVTPDDHSGILYVVAFLACTYSTLTFLTRCCIKWQVIGMDDAAMAVAQMVSYVQFAFLLVSLSAGLGKSYEHLSAKQYSRMVSFQFSNQIALYISLGFSKIATILLTQRLFTRDMKKAWMICDTAIVSIVIWTALACFLASAGCSPESTIPQQPAQICGSIVVRYQIIVITDALTDVVLVAIPAYLCWQLQMSVLVKLQVLAVFSFRLPLIAFSSVFLRTWVDTLFSANPGVDRSLAITLQQIELCFSLIAGTVPCLKSFIRSFDTGSGNKAGFASSNGYGSYGHSTHSGSNIGRHTESYKMSSVLRSKLVNPYKRGLYDYDYNDDADHVGELRINPKPFTSACTEMPALASTPSHLTSFKKQPEGHDRSSQGDRQELCIRKEQVWEVSSDVRRDSDTPGMLKLPK